MLEGQVFAIYTDHKPITFAFRQKLEKASPRQARHLDFISQFSTDIRHISGESNVVADALSRSEAAEETETEQTADEDAYVAYEFQHIEAVENPIDYAALATAQKSDEELNVLLHSETSLQFKKVMIPGTETHVLCDTSKKTARPYVTPAFRKAAFDSVHHLSHPGVKATAKLVADRFVWPSIQKDCKEWARTCIPCQQSKITRHVHAPLTEIKPPSSRFEHVHIDIIVMPSSEGNRYCLTCVDRFTRWPEAFPMVNQEAETVARAFYEGWICRVGPALRVTTDQGRQFESHLFNALNRIAGTKHYRTTSYHPQSNGMVERLHRNLKAAIRCHQNEQWTRILPTVLLGIRAAWREDIGATSAELVYGQPIRLPGEFLASTSNPEESSALLQNLRDHLQRLQPTPVQWHGERNPFLFKDLATTTHVFVRHDAIRNSLQMPYDGPYPVISRSEKWFVVKINGKDTPVSIDRLKPVYTLVETTPRVQQTTTLQTQQIINQRADPGLAGRPPMLIIQDNQPPGIQEENQPQIPEQPQEQPQQNVPRRSGRRVRFVERYQAGFP